MDVDDAPSAELTRDDLLCAAGSLLLEFRGRRRDKRGRLMGDVAEWILTLADPHSSPAQLEGIARDIAEWNEVASVRDANRRSLWERLRK